jgi:hypothetical protein
MAGILNLLKRAKNRTRQLFMGNRGKWNAAGATRKMNNGSNAKRTLLGRLKNRTGNFLFGTRQNRKLSGKLKNSIEAFLEKRLPSVGVTKSRQHEMTTKEINAVWHKFTRQAKRARRHQRAVEAKRLPVLSRALMYAALLGEAARPPPPPEPMFFTVPAMAPALSFRTARSATPRR